ncbi:VOC family protein [Pararhodobacter oceanensis]|uniref:VOC family protein n=1 Tax=Pararhodobacter oceanensis TaxID=2172121 RepID=UPI003A8E8705
MAITGIETLVYGVENINECVAFFEDFGLNLKSRSEECAQFQLEEGSKVEIRSIKDPSLPDSILQGTGVREVIWGVDSTENLEALVASLQTDRDLRRDADGTAHFKSDCGLPLGLRLYDKKKVLNCPDPLNAPGVAGRLNVSRKWRLRARPKTITHVVFAVEDFVASHRFFEERLGFRLSEYQIHLGIYMRCNGASDHHNLFLLDMNSGSAPGYPIYHHANFGVEDIDELMVGTNHMKRRGWSVGGLGQGRHRIASALFSYFKSPTGGEVEYGSDSDYLDDNYVPREWNALFGLQTWMTEQPEWIKNAQIEWHAKHMTEGMPAHIRSIKDLPDDGKLA